MNTIPKATVLALCGHYGPQIHTPPGVDGAKIMYAIAGCESTWGHDTAPRHEPAYDVGGALSHGGIMPALLAKYGHSAACSYGPWQVMAVNAPQFTPTELANDPDKAAQAFVAFLNTFVLHARGARTVAQIAETYNSGKFVGQLPEGVLKYASECQEYYASAP